MRKILKWSVILAAVAIAVVLAALPRPPEIGAVACRRGTIQALVSKEAETRLEDKYVVTMPVAGRLFRIDMKEGALVEAGSVIARVDTFEREEQLKRLDARVREAEALIVGVDKAKPKPEDIRSAELAVAEAKLSHEAAAKALETCRIDYQQETKQYERKKALFEEGSVPESDFDEAKRQYLMLKTACEESALKEEIGGRQFEQAEVKLKRIRESIDDNEYQRSAFQEQIGQIRAEHAILRDEIAKSTVRAPVSGPVLEKYQESEQVLPAGAPLLEIGDMKSIRVESDVLSEEVGSVKVGQDVLIFGPAVGEKPVRGKVERIYPSGFEKISSLGIEQQRVKVIVAFDNSELRLRPGVRLDISIVTDRKDDALLVPERALFKVSDRWHAFTVRDGRAKLTPVGLGLRNEEQAEVTSGLVEGDLVIPGPPQDLEDGDRVTVIATPPDTPSETPTDPAIEEGERSNVTEGKKVQRRVEGNYVLDVEVTGPQPAEPLRVLFSADEALKRYAFLELTPEQISIGRAIEDRTEIWKRRECKLSSPWKIRLLKKGNFYRFWVNGLEEWAFRPMGDEPEDVEPFASTVAVTVPDGCRITRAELTTLPWLQEFISPVIGRGPEGSFYEGHVLPGAIIRHEGRWYMYLMASMKGDQEGGSRRSIGVAWSDDLEHWTVHPEPVLSYSDTPFDNIYVDGAVHSPDGKVAVMYAGQKFPAWGGFFLATADHPLKPLKIRGDKPVVKHHNENAHEFDLVEIEHPDYRYILFYAGFTEKPTGGKPDMAGDRGYLLTSKDLINWRPAEGNPVFQPQTRDNWDAIHVRPRSLNLIDGTWYLWYEGCNEGGPDPHLRIPWCDSVGLARSKDLRKWEHYPLNPALAALGCAESYEKRWTGWPRMVVEGGTAYVFFTGDGAVALRKIPVAKLTDWNSEGGETTDLLAR